MSIDQTESEQKIDPSKDQIDALKKLHASGRLSQTEQACKNLLRTCPTSGILLDLLGVSLKGQGRLEEAVHTFDNAIQQQPDFADAYSNRGDALLGLGQFGQAVQSYDQAIQLQPDLAAAYSNRGNALQGLGELERAVHSYSQAIQLRPNLAVAYNNRGNALQGLGQFQQAVSNYDQAIQVKPDYSEAYCNRASALRRLGRPEQALRSYDQAIRIKPDFADAYSNRGNALKDLGLLEQAMSSYENAIRLKPDLAEARSNWLLAANFAASRTPVQNIVEARKFGATVAGKRRIRFDQYQCSSAPQKLRVGFVSGDLRNHPVGYFLESVLAHFDPARIELIAYPTARTSDDLTQRIKPHFSAWHPVHGQSDDMAAQLIHNDGIHVLIDLAGHTANNRLPVFSSKPAPVQASWLGYFATTGLSEMDYLIGDPYVTPPGEEGHHTETVWRLPEAYFCFTAPDVPLQVNALPAASEGGITLGCFNNLAKIGDSVVSTWARILTTIPASRLFLKTHQLNDQAVREEIHRRFAQAGIARSRVLLEGHSPRAELLAAYHRVDIALDPYPYPGGTTSLEALWMGVPVITKCGDRFLSHVGETIAHNAGLSNWVAANEDEYVAKVAAFAANFDALASLRACLRQKILASPLFDARRFTKNLEDSLWGMWQHWQEAQEGKQ